MVSFLPTTESNLRTGLGVEICKLCIIARICKPLPEKFSDLCSEMGICSDVVWKVYKYKGSVDAKFYKAGLRWKPPAPLRGLASLILMSKYAQSRQFFGGVAWQHFTRLVKGENYQHISCPQTCLININEQICALTAVLWGGFLTIFYKAGLRWKLPAYFLFTDLQFEIWFWNEKTYFNFEAWIYSTVYGYFTEANCKYLKKYSCVVSTILR